MTRADRQPNYWLWVTSSEYYLDEDGREASGLEDICSWSCARDTRAGDLVLLWRTTLKDPVQIARRRQRGDGPVGRDIACLIRAESDSYPDVVWKWGCECSTLYVFPNPVTLQDMNRSRTLSQWGPLKAKFRGRAFRIIPDIWDALIQLATAKNPGLLDALATRPHVVRAIAPAAVAGKPAQQQGPTDGSLHFVDFVWAGSTRLLSNWPHGDGKYSRTAGMSGCCSSKARTGQANAGISVSVRTRTKDENRGTPRSVSSW